MSGANDNYLAYNYRIKLNLTYHSKAYVRNCAVADYLTLEDWCHLVQTFQEESMHRQIQGY